MNKLALAATTLACFAVTFAGPLHSASAPSSESGKTETWKGYVTDTWCGVNRDKKVPDVACTNECVQSNRAKYAFYNFADGQVYVLNPQADAAKYAGQTVVVKGTVDSRMVPMKTMRGDREGKTITASAISPDKL